MAADPAVLKRNRACPFARGGHVLVRNRAKGYSLFARRSGEPLVRLRLTGEVDDVVLLYPSHRGGWEPPGDCHTARSRWSASAAILTSWRFGRPTVERRRHRRSTETALPINFSYRSQPFPLRRSALTASKLRGVLLAAQKRPSGSAPK